MRAPRPAHGGRAQEGEQEEVASFTSSFLRPRDLSGASVLCEPWRAGARARLSVRSRGFLFCPSGLGASALARPHVLRADTPPVTTEAGRAAAGAPRWSARGRAASVSPSAARPLGARDRRRDSPFGPRGGSLSPTHPQHPPSPAQPRGLLTGDMGKRGPACSCCPPFPVPCSLASRGAAAGVGRMQGRRAGRAEGDARASGSAGARAGARKRQPAAGPRGKKDARSARRSR